MAVFHVMLKHTCLDGCTTDHLMVKKTERERRLDALKGANRTGGKTIHLCQHGAYRHGQSVCAGAIKGLTVGAHEQCDGVCRIVDSTKPRLQSTKTGYIRKRQRHIIIGCIDPVNVRGHVNRHGRRDQLIRVETRLHRDGHEHQQQCHHRGGHDHHLFRHVGLFLFLFDREPRERLLVCT